jgi:hypothetical protein
MREWPAASCENNARWDRVSIGRICGMHMSDAAVMASNASANEKILD